MADRRFTVTGLRTLAAVPLAATLAHSAVAAEPPRRPNIVFVFADQWRADATGYAGDPNVITPHLDQLESRSVNFTHAVSICPVCSPYRATLMTGQRPLTHGLFVNDVPLEPKTPCLGEVLRDAGYDTAYIGKWHIDGHGRTTYIPPERRRGFDYFKVLECTHVYHHSPYYADDDPTLRYWPGYDAFAQTLDARQFIEDHAQSDRPFALVMSWGPPHNPYQWSLPKYKAMYDQAALKLRPNVPEDESDVAREELLGYYAHCTALDDAIGWLMDTLRRTGVERDTIVVFTSDHGDMLHSHGDIRKQKPWDESIRVPLLIHYPAALGEGGRRSDEMINTEDLMPTLLGLAGVAIPQTVEGLDYSGYLRGGPSPGDGAALIASYTPFGEWVRAKGGREYRGIRTRRYTYVRDLTGPWLLFDNEADPYQQNNLVNQPEHAALQAELDARLQAKLTAAGDTFEPGKVYIEKWGWTYIDTEGDQPKQK